MNLEADALKLTGLNCLAYQHPEDRVMLSKLKVIPLADQLVTELVDRQKIAMEMDLIANSVFITPDIMPQVYEVFCRACRALDFKEPFPHLYVGHGLEINAYTTGADEPYVCLNAGAVERLSDEELLFVIGHELGHIQCQHVKYTTLARLLTNVAGIFGSKIPVLGNVISIGLYTTIIPLLYRWMRRAEFTCDRAGLLACQDRAVALTALIKLAGFPFKYASDIDPDIFLRQYEEYHRRLDHGLHHRMSDLMAVAQRSHPCTVERVALLQYWIDDGSFDELIQATTAERRMIAERNDVKPELAELHGIIANTLIIWAMKEFNATRQEVAQPLRKMLNLQQSPRSTKVEPILRAEWGVTQISQTKLEYYVLVLFNKQRKLVRAKLELPYPEDFDEAPAEIRDEFIRHGKKEIVRWLYTAKETKS